MQVHQVDQHGLAVSVSADDTEDWATRPGAAWPCSTLRGRRFSVRLDGSGDLVDFAIQGESEPDSRELLACLADLLKQASRQPWRYKSHRKHLARYAEEQASRL